MEEILLRLQTLENELKKEREINRTLQFQIADMNEDVNLLKEKNEIILTKYNEVTESCQQMNSTLIDQRVCNIEKHLCSFEKTNRYTIKINRVQFFKDDYSNVNRIEEYKSFISNKTDFTMYHFNSFMYGEPAAERRVLISNDKFMNRLNNADVLVLEKGDSINDKPDSSGIIHQSIDISKQKDYILCRTNQLNEYISSINGTNNIPSYISLNHFNIGNNSYFVGSRIKDTNNVRSLNSNKIYTFNGFSYELVN